MRRYWTREFITLTIIGILSGSAPLSAASGTSGNGNGNGKKAFVAAQKLEAAGKFDEAAELYLMALGQEPSKPEYNIGFRRASAEASVTLVKKGRELMEQGKYEDAYNAFRRAYQFDQTNDLAKDLAKKALERQRQIEGISTVPVNVQPYGGTGEPGQSNRLRPPEQKPNSPAGDKDKKEVAQVISYHDMLRPTIAALARQLDLNVAFDNTFTDKRIDIDLRNVTKPQALDIILQTQGLFFAPITDNTLIVSVDNTTNRNRLQNLSVQTFFLRNADPQQVQTQVAAIFGNRVLVVPSQELRAVSVRTSPENLKLIERIVNTLDKNKPEVVIDVSIYEVSRSDTIEIGNQVLFDGFLGQNQNLNSPSTLNFLGVTAGQILTAQRFALAIPTSVIRLLQNRGTNRLVDSLQVHALDGQQVTANVGQRVPIQTASLPFGISNLGTTTNPQTGIPNPTNPGQLNPAAGLYGGIPQIEYQPVGLNVQITPTIYSDDDVKLEMVIESSSLAATSTSTLTPTITTRTLRSFATVKTGQAAMMAGVAQKRAGQSRGGVPVLGFLPVVGRFFSVPKDTNDTIDLLITVTPHIIRAADINDQDRLAKLAGTQNTGGLGGSIESFLEERDAKRALQAPGVNTTTTTTTTTTAAQLDPVLREGNSMLAGPAQAASQLIASARQVAMPVAETKENRGGTVPDVMASNSRVNVLLYPDVAQPKAGESMQLSVLVQGSGDLSESVIALTFDPGVLRVREITDGGLLSAAGAPAQIVAQRDSDGHLVVTVRPAKNTGPKTARGRLVVINFDVVSAGSSAIRVEEGASRFVLSDGKIAACSGSPVIIQAR